MLPKLVGHVDTTSIAEVLVRLMGADEGNALWNEASKLEWLTKSGLIDMLVDRCASYCVVLAV